MSSNKSIASITSRITRKNRPPNPPSTKMTSSEQERQRKTHKAQQSPPQKSPPQKSPKSQVLPDWMQYANKFLQKHDEQHPENTPLRIKNPGDIFNLRKGGNGSTIKVRSLSNSKIKTPSPPYRYKSSKTKK